MPRIFGLNLAAVLLASVVFYFVGFLWYGVIFMNAWMDAHEMTADDGVGGIWMAGGFVITLLQVIGIAKVMQWRGVVDILGALGTAFILWLFLALPFVHYAYIYLPSHNHVTLMIDASHFLVGWSLSAVVLSLFKK